MVIALKNIQMKNVNVRCQRKNVIIKNVILIILINVQKNNDITIFFLYWIIFFFFFELQTLKECIIIAVCIYVHTVFLISLI